MSAMARPSAVSPPRPPGIDDDSVPGMLHEQLAGWVEGNEPLGSSLLPPPPAPAPPLPLVEPVVGSPLPVVVDGSTGGTTSLGGSGTTGLSVLTGMRLRKRAFLGSPGIRPA